MRLNYGDQSKNGPLLSVSFDTRLRRWINRPPFHLFFDVARETFNNRCSSSIFRSLASCVPLCNILLHHSLFSNPSRQHHSYQTLSSLHHNIPPSTWQKKRRRDSLMEMRWNWERDRADSAHRGVPAPPTQRPASVSSDWQNNPILPVISYCASSILMTVANKYILSFPDYNLNFFLLAVQVCRNFEKR